MLEFFAIDVFDAQLFISIIVLAFICELVDSSLGMGYGTTLTPVLLIVGFGPLAIVPAVLLSELLSGITAGIVHHKAGNVNFSCGSIHLKIVLVLAACSIVGTIIAVVIALRIPALWLKTYIGILVLAMGLILLLTLHKKFPFSWKKITGLGLIAAFNKGMSGGGYGPVVTGGQLLSGVNGNNAVGITSLAEGLTCVVGVIIYVISPDLIDWSLAPSLVIGALLSVPFSAFIVRKMPTQTLKIAIAVVTILLGVYTLYNIFYS